MTPDARKSELRRTLKERLMAIPPERWNAASTALVGRIQALNAFRNARHVMLFVPIRNEVDITGLAFECSRTGKTVWLPRVEWQTDTMSAVAAPEGDLRSMNAGRFGLREPSPQAEVAPPERLDLIIVPGLAFDLRRGRLGRGKGFYDKFLANPRLNALKIGACIEEQIVDELPMEEWDVRPDAIVTDSRVIGTVD